MEVVGPRREVFGTFPYNHLKDRVLNMAQVLQITNLANLIHICWFPCLDIGLASTSRSK